MFCDSLRAHVANQVRKLFGDAKVLLCLFPKNMTEMVQPIDAGWGRSLRCKIGYGLDTWLMSEDNLSKWEGKLQLESVEF